MDVEKMKLVRLYVSDKYQTSYISMQSLTYIESRLLPLMSSVNIV